MTDLLAVAELPAPVLADLRAQFPGLGTVALDDLDAALHSDSPALVVAPASAGVPFAQVVHAAVPDAAVVLVADHGEIGALRAALLVAPGISRRTRALSATDPDLVQHVAEEADAALRRQQHRRTMTEVRTQLGQLPVVPPERVSRYFGLLFDHAPMGIVIADGTGLVRGANAEVEVLLGCRPALAVGSELGTLFGPTTEAQVQRLVESAVNAGETGKAITEVVEHTGRRGAIQHLEVRVAVVDPSHPQLGVIVLLRDDTERLTALAAVERERTAAQASAERSATLARTLQDSLLPRELPVIPGVQVAAVFHPAGDGSQVGGDFYDVFPVEGDDWFAVVGDVCGKGAEAARLTAMARYALRTAAIRSPGVAAALAEVNEVVLRQSESGPAIDDCRFITAAAVRLRSEGDGVRLEVVSAGHPPPLVVRADGTVEELACRGSLLGIMSPVRLDSCAAHLAPGDVLVLYTDGVLEARRNGEFFGERRLHRHLEAIGPGPARRVADELAAAVLTFQHGIATDDMAVLTIAPG